MTTRAQPATIFGELLEKVSAVLDGRPTNDLELRRWENEAEKLLRADRGEGLEIKAILAAIHEDDVESDRLYEAALSCSGDYTSTAVRYLTVLGERLRSEKLLETFLAIRSAFKGDPEATRYVERLLANNGFLLSAWELSRDLDKMGSFSAATPSGASEVATQQIELEEYGDMDFGAPVSFAKRFLANRGIYWKSTSVAASVGEDSKEVFFYQIRVDQSPEEATQTESALFEALEKEAFPVESNGKMVLALIGTRVSLA